MAYTENELHELIKTVEKEFTTHLSKAETLAKSEGADSKPPKKEEGKDKAPKKDESAGKEAPGKEASAEGAPAAAPAEGEAPAAAAPAEGAAPAAAAPAAAANNGAPGPAGIYDEEDRAHMDNMYKSMSREELMEHHDSVRRALDALGAQGAAPGAAPAAPAAGAAPMGKSEIKDENPVLNSKPKDKGNETNSAYNENSGGKIEGNEPRNSPGAKSPASKAEGMQMEKSEKEFDLLKSELEAEKAKTAELTKNMNGVQEYLTKLVSKVAAPKGKAITEIGTIEKSEGGGEVKELSKAEVTEILLRKSSDPTLSKADRQAINDFYLGGSNFNTISHLLK